ncbi:DUF3854 domain-containing protein [Kocuria rosea]|uniref:DUF3854 domain-containing protein n=1 Tax=Kocuria rosea TaxID=1275 RepID=UPI002040F76B|nr:DUF3854 domain-containing protein [Kocuria rosea]MCM3687830.1 DUF3854 domain-containing protein [Kocuria rosea]
MSTHYNIAFNSDIDDDEFGPEDFVTDEDGFDDDEFGPEDFITDEDGFDDEPEQSYEPDPEPAPKRTRRPVRGEDESLLFRCTDPDEIGTVTDEELARFASLAPAAQFTAADYAPFLTGSGAAKLADSAVAPLVAAARGYFDITPENFEARMKEMGQRKNSGTYKKWDRVMNVTGHDGMAMPWFSVTTVHTVGRGAPGAVLKADEWQVRPSHPQEREASTPEKPKFEKYMFPAKAKTPLDIHPATPVEWIDHTPLVMVTEGLLKGDSALTGWLLDAGIAREDLLDVPEDPMARLRELMNEVPAEDRILFTTIAGVNNIMQNPMDWRNISFAGRTVRIAFDADLGKNINVWRAGYTLEQMLLNKQKVKRIEWLIPHMDGEDGEKAGVDDYLARHTWAELERHVVDRIPLAPPVDQRWDPGDWQITDDGTSAEEYKVISSDPGLGNQYGWKQSWKLGGRIASMESSRRPTDEELRTGTTDSSASSDNSDSSIVAIEVTWESDEGIQTATITGPSRILNYSPAEWDKKGAKIPGTLLRHPHWPIYGNEGMKWLSAVKKHRHDEVMIKQRWDQMGWVPVEDGGVPAFTVGNRVIGDDEHLDSVYSAVDDGVVPGAAKYGVGDHADVDWTHDADRELVRADFQTIIDHYITSGAWTDPAVAAAILATALRPAVPLRPETTMFIYGPPGKGKSWSASTQMYFWAASSQCWNDGTLPGSAKDTAAVLEHRVSRVPFYVVDDMAPSQSASEAEREQSKLETLTRNIFNNASRGRMNSSMVAQKVNLPIAQLVITAENPFNTPSVRQRLVPIHIGHGSLSADKTKTDALNKLHTNDGVQGRFTAHLISYIRHAANVFGGWEPYLDSLTEHRTGLRNSIAQMMADRGFPLSSVQRVAKLAADMSLTYLVLSQMATELGMDLDFIHRFDVEDGLIELLVDHMAAAHAESRTVTPGVSLLKAIRDLLRTQGAHVASAEDPGRPPLVNSSDHGKEGANVAIHNVDLGWRAKDKNEYEAPGPRIGVAKWDEAEGDWLIQFFHNPAFDEASKRYPRLIPPGQSASSSWTSVWDEGLAAPKKKRRKRNGNIEYTCRVRMGDKQETGVPVLLKTLMNIDDAGNESTGPEKVDDDKS